MNGRRAAPDGRTGMSAAPATGRASVPEGSVVYAIGDIHGEAARLDRLHAAILADARSRDPRRKIAVYLGDYVDRGPDSAGVIDRLLGDPLPGFERVFLMGNHEEFLLHFLEVPRTWGGWAINGGEATLASYDVDARDFGTWSLDTDALRTEFAARLPEPHRRFLEGLALWHCEGDYLFVHAGVRPGRPLADQRRSDLLWIRDEFLNSDRDHGHIVVHGHTPSDIPDVHHNRIGIDTGAVYGGKLTALVLEDATRSFIQV